MIATTNQTDVVSKEIISEETTEISIGHQYNISGPENIQIFKVIVSIRKFIIDEAPQMLRKDYFSHLIASHLVDIPLTLSTPVECPLLTEDMSHETMPTKSANLGDSPDYCIDQVRLSEDKTLHMSLIAEYIGIPGRKVIDSFFIDCYRIAVNEDKETIITFDNVANLSSSNVEHIKNYPNQVYRCMEFKERLMVDEVKGAMVDACVLEKHLLASAQRIVDTIHKIQNPY